MPAIQQCALCTKVLRSRANAAKRFGSPLASAVRYGAASEGPGPLTSLTFHRAVGQLLFAIENTVARVRVNGKEYILHITRLEIHKRSTRVQMYYKRLRQVRSLTKVQDFRKKISERSSAPRSSQQAQDGNASSHNYGFA